MGGGGGVAQGKAQPHGQPGRRVAGRGLGLVHSYFLNDVKNLDYIIFEWSLIY
jgi:hypothetical protein